MAVERDSKREKKDRERAAETQGLWRGWLRDVGSI